MTCVSPYREVDHTADLALLVWAPTLEGLFADAAQGMYALTGVEVRPGPQVSRQIEVSAQDHEALLVAWLQELLYGLETEAMVFEDFRVQLLQPSRLTVAVQGRPAGPVTKIIKAVTYHNLNIAQTSEGYSATVVFDV
jgi:SHS2 domain-containing protein